MPALRTDTRHVRARATPSAAHARRPASRRARRVPPRDERASRDTWQESAPVRAPRTCARRRRRPSTAVARRHFSARPCPAVCLAGGGPTSCGRGEGRARSGGGRGGAATSRPSRGREHRGSDAFGIVPKKIRTPRMVRYFSARPHDLSGLEKLNFATSCLEMGDLPAVRWSCVLDQRTSTFHDGHRSAKCQDLTLSTVCLGRTNYYFLLFSFFMPDLACD